MMLWFTLLIIAEVPMDIPLGIQTLLSEFVMIIQEKALLCNVALLMNMG